MLIAFLDPSDAQHERAVSELRSRMTGGEQLLVGASVYAEVMVRPLAQGTDAKVDEFLKAAGAKVLPVDRTLARRAAALQARHRSLRLGDALSLTTALLHDADLVTFDRGLRRIVKREEGSDEAREQGCRRCRNA